MKNPDDAPAVAVVVGVASVWATQLCWRSPVRHVRTLTAGHADSHMPLDYRNQHASPVAIHAVLDENTTAARSTSPEAA